MNLTVQWYSQVLGRDETSTPFDLAQTAAYQSYDRINNFLTKLQGSFSASFDTATQELTVTGTLTIFPVIIPNTSDVFVADSGDGNSMLFTITQIRPKSYRSQTTWEIDFVGVRYMSQAIQDNLDSKVVQDLYFQRDLLSYGQNPLLNNDQVVAGNTLSEMYTALQTRFLNDFYSSEFSTILVPGQDAPTYDHYATKAFLRISDIIDSPLIGKIRIFNLDDNSLSDRYNMWDMLIDKVDRNREICFNNAGLVYKTMFNWHAQLRSVRYSGMTWVLVPQDRDCGADEQYKNTIRPVRGLYVQEYDGTPLCALGQEEYGYVLGQYFWGRNRGQMLAMEQMADRALKNEDIGVQAIDIAYNAILKLPPVHRFYLTLLLMIIIKLELRNAG